MSLVYEERASDSPHVETVIRGYTESDGATIRPAAVQWHMVLRKLNGSTQLLVVGPLTTAGIASWGEGAELLWIKLRLGAFMPGMPITSFLDQETPLPGATRDSFWLNDSAWQFPDYDHVETFVERLARNGVLACDPVVGDTLQDRRLAIASRTVRYRFLRATGLTRSHVWQMERAQQAEALLRQGKSILDTVDEAGYFDQPHLTRSLKQFIGYTPAQIIRMSRPDCQTVQDTLSEPGYHEPMMEVIR